MVQNLIITTYFDARVPLIIKLLVYCIYCFMLLKILIYDLSSKKLIVCCSKNLRKGTGLELIVIVILSICGNFTNVTREDIEWKICRERSWVCESLELLVLTLESMALYSCLIGLYLHKQPKVSLQLIHSVEELELELELCHFQRQNHLCVLGTREFLTVF